MYTKTVETFNFPFGVDSIYHKPISQSATITFDECGYKPWVGGCAIHGYSTVRYSARHAIFLNVKQKIQSQIDYHKKSLEILNRTLNQLGDDSTSISNFQISRKNR